jgi:16S rRNA (guanine527-N7)-methyltransferase
MFEKSMFNDNLQKHSPLELLNLGLNALSITASAAQCDNLLHYLALIQKWNQAFNLTAITELPEMVVLHLLDSLAIGQYLQGSSFADVGTGAGLPGIPLAMLFPDKEFILIESLQKRCNFLTTCKATFKLANVQIINARAEQYQPNNKFDGVITRAFSDLDKMQAFTKHLLKESGAFYAMKADLATEKAIPPHAQIIPLTVPFLGAQRHLLIIPCCHPSLRSG